MSGRNIEKRGRNWYLRWRVPKKYRTIEKRPEINISLGTDSHTEAQELAVVAKANLKAEWEALLAGKVPTRDRDKFNAMMALGRSKGLAFATVEQIATGTMEEITRRLDLLQREPVDSPVVAVALGGVEPPSVLVSEMPAEMARIRSEDVGGKNARQLREWKNKFKRAAEAFKSCVGDKPVTSITVADARRYKDHWRTKRKQDKLTTDYANKQIGYMRAIVDAYYADAEIDQFLNPFSGLSFGKTGAEVRSAGSRQKELPVSWITDVLLDPLKTAGLNDEARDIAIISAESGGRATEIYDVPAEHVHLDADIPHILIWMVEEGEQKRQLKNTASIRAVPLLGHALDAMKRHPEGFPRYRGKATYSGAINKFMKENELFPGEGYTIKGLRHTFETRLRRAGVDNEERAQLMGHSLKRIRGREIYGDETELKLRALYAEMIALPTPTWKPRSHVELRAEIGRVLEEEGYRVK